MGFFSGTHIERMFFTSYKGYSSITIREHVLHDLSLHDLGFQQKHFNIFWILLPVDETISHYRP